MFGCLVAFWWGFAPRPVGQSVAAGDGTGANLMRFSTPPSLQTSMSD